MKTLIKIVICCWVLTFPSLYAQAKPPKDDPRNPDCNCHVFQALADKEYKAMNRKSVVVNKFRNRNLELFIQHVEHKIESIFQGRKKVMGALDSCFGWG